MVLANVGAALEPAIASTSVRYIAMPPSSALAKSPTTTRSNGGTPPYLPAHGASNGGSAALRNPALAASLPDGLVPRGVDCFRVDADVRGAELAFIVRVV